MAFSHTMLNHNNIIIYYNTASLLLGPFGSFHLFACWGSRLGGVTVHGFLLLLPLPYVWLEYVHSACNSQQDSNHYLVSRQTEHNEFRSVSTTFIK